MAKDNIKKITIGCFSVLAAWDIIELFSYFNFLALLATIGSILIVIALLKRIPLLSAVGFGLMALQGVVSIFQNIEAILEGWLPPSILLVWVLNITVYVFLILVSIMTKSAKKLGIIAAIIAMIRTIVVCIRNAVEGYGFFASSFLWGVLFSAGAMLLALSYDNYAKNAPISTPHKGITDEQSPSAINNMDKLLRLKKLLDEGTITQEEFDAKKKQLLGM